MYKHIKDCWNAIEKLIDWEGSTPDDLEDLLGRFPRWSGDWLWEVYESDDDYMLRIINCYWIDDDYYEDQDVYSPGELFIYKYNEE